MQDIGYWSARVRAFGSALGAGAILICCAANAQEFSDPFEDTYEREVVGFGNPDRIILPVNQILSPAGLQVDLPEMRPQAIALSGDGELLVTSGKTHELVVVDPGTGVILQKVKLPSEKAADETAAAVSTHIL